MSTEKKSWIARLFDKLDKKLKAKADEKGGCCCCSETDKKDGECCSK